MASQNPTTPVRVTTHRTTARVPRIRVLAAYGLVRFWTNRVFAPPIGLQRWSLRCG